MFRPRWGHGPSSEQMGHCAMLCKSLSLVEEASLSSWCHLPTHPWPRPPPLEEEAWAPLPMCSWSCLHPCIHASMQHAVQASSAGGQCLARSSGLLWRRPVSSGPGLLWRRPGPFSPTGPGPGLLRRRPGPLSPAALGAILCDRPMFSCEARLKPHQSSPLASALSCSSHAEQQKEAL